MWVECNCFSQIVGRLDGYPQRFDCSNPTKWNPVVLNYHQYHEEVNPSQPWYIPEFQAGAFDAWGPSSPGYQACQQLTDANFMSVFNLQLWASNAKLINYYMLYGCVHGMAPLPFTRADCFAEERHGVLCRSRKFSQSNRLWL